jgi:hypothetical protein
MSTWGKVILTKQGEALLNQCLGMSGHYNLNQSNDPDSDTKGIVITRVSTGRYRYTNTSVEYLKERTDLATSDGATGGTSGFVENLNITGLNPITSSNSDQYGQALIQVQLDNQREDRNIKEEYPLGQLGVFARLEGSTEEILFTIVQYAGDTLPVIPAPVTPTLLNFGFYIAIATTETISIEMEFTGIVTAKQFDDYKLVTDETLNTLNEHTKNTENPHKVTAQQVGLGNVPNVTTDNQTPTFTQSSTLSEINSGEKLSTLFGKIKKAIVDLISHIGSKSNPHSVTKSQVGLGNVPNVTTDNQTPTFTQSSTLSEINSGEKLSTLFGKIKKAIVDLISHIGSKSNPHSVTKSQVGLGNVPNVATNDQQPTFAESGTRSNIVSGETLSTLFGKIKKFFADLKTVAFTGSYTDLSNKPTSMQNPNSLTLTMNGSATNYNGASSASKSWYAPTSAGTSGYEMVSNGSGAPVWKPPSYAVCSTSGNTAVKTVSISNFKLTTGVRVLVKFTYEHTSSTAATLNVNSTGAKNIVVHCGTDNIFVKDYFSWLAGETVELVYDGSYWVAIASDMRFITGAQSATVVIGTTKTQGFCDFRCDGTNDAECFNKAIRRIKTILSRNPPKEDSMMWRYGGTILVKTGVYNINSTISIGQSITKDIFTFKGEGPFSTWIQTKDLQCFMKNFNSLCFKDLYLTCDGLNEGPYFDSGDNLTFENCYISVGNSTSNVGVFADLNTQYTGEDPGEGSSGELQQGCFVLRGSTMTIKTLSTSSNCFSGINCGVLKVDDSEINLFNNSNSTSFELNFAYLAMTGYISNSIIHCSGKSSIVNSGAINITGNVIYLHSSNSRIYHYNTSITEVGGVFNANTVYCAYYVYLRCATITGNKFLKLNEYQSNSVACYLYNPCSASITGNFFHGGASGTWYIDAASKGSLNVLCNNYKGTLAVRNTVTQNNAYNLSVNY